MSEDRTRMAEGHDEHFVALHSGFKLGKYELQAVLGQGGFGITYRAWDGELNRAVAIKEYLPSDVAVRIDGSTVRARSRNDQDSFQWGLERFLDEARALARFDHSGAVVRVYDYMQANGTAYMVMALVEGEPLSALYRREAPLSEERLKAIVLPVLDGLEDVHQAGFLHRDIKPANILIRANGQPVLIDFGAARQALGEKSRSITSVFTPGYAPFEQYTSSGKQGPWTDIYALAATLYHGVTGKVPVQATDRIREDAMEPAVRAGAGRYSETFLAAIDAGLEVFENRRPQSVAQWRAMLTGDLAVPQPTTQPSVQAPMPAATGPATGMAASQAAPSQVAPPPRGRGLLAAIGIVVLLVLAGGGYAAWTQIEAERIATEQRLQQEAEARATAEKTAAELQAREAARLQAENEAKSRAAAEARRLAEQEAARQKAEADARAREETEARIRAEAEAKIRAELEATRKAEEEARRRAEAESRRKAEEEAKKRAEAEMQARAQAEAEAKAKAAAEEKARREAAARAATAAPPQQAAAAFPYAGTWRLVIECPNTPMSPFSDYTIPANGPTLTNSFYRDGKGQGRFAGDRFTYRFGFTGRGGAFLRGELGLSARGPTRFTGGGTVYGFGQGSSERSCTAEMTKL